MRIIVIPRIIPIYERVLNVVFKNQVYETLLRDFFFFVPFFVNKTNKFLVRFLFRYPSSRGTGSLQQTISRFATRTRIFLRRESGILMRSPPPPTAESCRFRLINPHVSVEYIISSLSSLFLFLFRTRTPVSLTRVTIGRFGRKERRSFQTIPRVHKRCSTEQSRFSSFLLHICFSNRAKTIAYVSFIVIGDLIHERTVVSEFQFQ